VQYPGLQGGGALGEASTPGTPADSIAASVHGGTYSHVAVAGETLGGEMGVAAGTAAAVARRRLATPMGGAFTPPRSAPLTAPLDGRPTGRRNRSRRAGRSPAGHRGRVQPPYSLRAVAAPNSGRWGVVGGQASSGPCDRCGRTVLLRHVTLFAFSVIATLSTSERPPIPEDTNADCHL